MNKSKIEKILSQVDKLSSFEELKELYEAIKEKLIAKTKAIQLQKEKESEEIMRFYNDMNGG